MFQLLGPGSPRGGFERGRAGQQRCGGVLHALGSLLGRREHDPLFKCRQGVNFYPFEAFEKSPSHLRSPWARSGRAAAQRSRRPSPSAVGRARPCVPRRAPSGAAKPVRGAGRRGSGARRQAADPNQRTRRRPVANHDGSQHHVVLVRLRRQPNAATDDASSCVSSPPVLPSVESCSTTTAPASGVRWVTTCLAKEPVPSAPARHNPPHRPRR